jgi:CRISPR/Cas system-associated endoribonuclease Cas2
MTNSEKIKKVNEMLIEVIKDEEHQVLFYRFKGCCFKYRCRLLANHKRT